MPFVNGNEHDNTLVSGSHNDTMQAFGGNDEIFPGEGNDTVDGGGGIDTLVVVYPVNTTPVIMTMPVLTGPGTSGANAPGGDTSVIVGNPLDSAGQSFTFSAFLPSNFVHLWWGPQTPELSTNGASDPASDSLVFAAGFGTDTAIWTGTSTVTGTYSGTLLTRMTATLGSGTWIDAATVGLGSALDAVVQTDGVNFSVTLRFEVSSDGGSTWQAANSFTSANASLDAPIFQDPRTFAYDDHGYSGSIADSSMPNTDSVHFSHIEKLDITGGPAADILFGAGNDDLLDGAEGEDNLSGGGGNDSLTGGAGDDLIDGGAGTADIANFSGNLADYTITHDAGDQVTAIDNRPGSPDGTDTLHGIETLHFADADIVANHAPNIDLDTSKPGNDYTLHYNEGDPPALIVWFAADISDPDPGDPIEGATITITNPNPGDHIALIAPLPAGISVDGASTATNLILTGSATQGAYENAFLVVTFSSSSNDPTAGGNAVRTIHTTIRDGTADSAVATTTVNITAFNDAPDITFDSGDGASATLSETNAPLTASDTLSVRDPEATDTVTTLVTGVVATDTTLGLGSNNAQLKAMMSVTPGPIPADPSDFNNLTWTFDSTPQAFDYLAVGEHLTLTYTIQSTDNGSPALSDTQDIVITVNGTNEAPNIFFSPSDVGAIVKDETNAGLSGGGTLSVVDADQSDTVTASVTGVVASGTTLGLVPTHAQLLAMVSLVPGSLAADPGSIGNLAWNFDSGSEAFNYLNVGQTLTLTYTIQADDGHGGTDTQDLSVTIHATNDNPTISVFSPSDSDSVSLTDGSSALFAQGTLTVVDPDLSDSTTNSIFSLLSTPAFVAGFPLMTVAPSHLAADPGPLSPANLTWQFAAGPTTFDFLAAGETQTLTYGLLVTDDSGANAVKTVTVTIHGINEAPVIGSSLPPATAVVELPDGSPGENVSTLSGTGTINYSDTDVSDTHSASFIADGAGYAGVFSLGAVDQVNNTVGWTFNVGDGLLNYLGAGATVHQSYTVTVSDGHGGTSSIVIGVDLIGSNDAAVLSSANVLVTQGLAPVMANGVLTITDEDNPALFQPLTDFHGTYGTLNLAAGGAWSYLADSALLGLAPTDVATDSFTVHAVDGTPTTITVSIAGSNDIAVAQMDNFTTTEAASLGSGLNLFNNNGSGADSDPDGPPLSISAVNGDAALVGHQIHLASGSLLTVNANGTFSYDPNHAFDTLTLASGAVNQSQFDSFSYTLAGGTTGTVFVNVAGLNSVDDLLKGNSLDNVITGFDASGDSFRLEQGGNDTAYGLGGNDGFFFGAAYDNNDTVFGGGGTDTIALQGNTNAHLDGVHDVDVVLALSGSDTSFGDMAGNAYSYLLTTSDGDVGAGQVMTVIGTGLQPGENLTFDGSAETDGGFRMFAGQGTDSLTGGGGSDGFFFGADGNLTAADQVDGGGGVDTIALRGNYSGANAVLLNASTMTHVEVLAMFSGHLTDFGGAIDPAGFDYDLTLANGNVAAGQNLVVAATTLGADESVRFDGRAETDGTLHIFSGAGDDTLWGGSGADLIYGGMGADRLIGGPGADVYAFLSAAESTGTHYDTIVGFDWSADRIDAPGGPRAITQSVSGGLSTASFDSDLAADLNGMLGAGGSALLNVNSGTLSGHVFAVIDTNGIAGYQAGADLVIDLVNLVAPIPTGAMVIV